MKNLSIHMPSLLLGLGFTTFVVIAMGQQIVGAPAVEVVRVLEPVRPLPPTPGEAVMFSSAVPYVVPANRSLIVTAIGGIGFGSNQDYAGGLSVNGVPVVSTRVGAHARGATAASMVALPSPGAIAQPGDTVELGASDCCGNNPAVEIVAWGYLVDA